MANRWDYSDWITLDGEARLTRLRLHIQEVSDFTQGTSTRSRSVTAVDPQYVQGLMREEKLLAQQFSVQSQTAPIARSNLAFRRD